MASLYPNVQVMNYGKVGGGEYEEVRNAYMYTDFSDISKPDPLPQPNETIYDYLKGNPEFSIFFDTLIENSNIKKKLQNPSGTYTFFAVPDFKYKFMAVDMMYALQTESPDDILARHTLPKVYSYADLKGNTRPYGDQLVYIPDVDGGMLRVDPRGLQIKLSRRLMSNTAVPTQQYDAFIIRSDIPLSNGVIHVVSAPFLV